jgi:hypothetical protein
LADAPSTAMELGLYSRSSLLAATEVKPVMARPS